MVDLDQLHRFLAGQTKTDLIELALHITASDFTTQNALRSVLQHKPRSTVLIVTLLLCIIDHVLVVEQDR